MQVSEGWAPFPTVLADAAPDAHAKTKGQLLDAKRRVQRRAALPAVLYSSVLTQPGRSVVITHNFPEVQRLHGHVCRIKKNTDTQKGVHLGGLGHFSLHSSCAVDASIPCWRWRQLL